MALKNRLQLDEEIMDIIRFRDMNKIKKILLLEFRRTKFSELTLDQLSKVVEIIEDAIEKGEV